MEESTLIIQAECDFIQDKSFQKELNYLFDNTIRICKERYDITAINALFERTFTKEEQTAYLQLLPNLRTLNYQEKYTYLKEKGLNSEQIYLLRESIFNAERFLDGSDYEMELKRNIFFEAWLKIYKK